MNPKKINYPDRLDRPVFKHFPCLLNKVSLHLSSFDNLDQRRTFKTYLLSERHRWFLNKKKLIPEKIGTSGKSRRSVGVTFVPLELVTSFGKSFQASKERITSSNPQRVPQSARRVPRFHHVFGSPFKYRKTKDSESGMIPGFELSIRSLCLSCTLVQITVGMSYVSHWTPFSENERCRVTRVHMRLCPRVPWEKKTNYHECV